MTRNQWKTISVIAIVAFALWKAYPPLDVYDAEGNLSKRAR